MLIAVLDPNRAVEDKYRDYAALTVDGRQFTGMITNESGSSITLTGTSRVVTAPNTFQISICIYVLPTSNNCPDT
jgi:hypothetical protein